MKIRSLLLGSIAAAGLSTGVQAADLGVLTSLDVCDSLGLSGLTISSDTNCLQITGSVSYRFQWGDWRNTDLIGVGTTQPGTAFVTNPGIFAADGVADWSSRLQTRLGIVATADSEFGPAAAHITFYESTDLRSNASGNALNKGGPAGSVWFDTSHTSGIVLDEAWVSIGDSTVIMAGRKGSIANFGTDTPYNHLGLFNSNNNAVGPDYNTIAPINGIGAGVSFNNNVTGTDLRFGGTVIQITSDLGNGFYASAGLENIDDAVLARAGTLVGVVGYNGDNVTAHITGAAGGALDGNITNFGVHAGAEVRFDAFRLTGAIAADNFGFVNALASASASFDMFTLAVSGEFVNTTVVQQAGVGGSISAAVTDGVTLNLGGRYFDSDLGTANNEFGQAELQAVAAVTETLTVTAGIGVNFQDVANNAGVISPYATGIVAWNPGGGFTTSLRGDVLTNSDEGNGYGFRTEFNAAKSFN